MAVMLLRSIGGESCNVNILFENIKTVKVYFGIPSIYLHGEFFNTNRRVVYSRLMYREIRFRILSVPFFFFIRRDFGFQHHNLYVYRPNGLPPIFFPSSNDTLLGFFLFPRLCSPHLHRS